MNIRNLDDLSKNSDELIKTIDEIKALLKEIGSKEQYVAAMYKASYLDPVIKSLHELSQELEKPGQTRVTRGMVWLALRLWITIVYEWLRDPRYFGGNPNSEPSKKIDNLFLPII